MLYKYTYIDDAGSEKEATIDAVNDEVAINSLQSRGIVLTSLSSADEKGFLEMDIKLFDHVSTRELVILSRQISTLFEAKVSALKVFRLLGSEVTNKTLRTALATISDEISGGSSISKAMEKHPKVFNNFYVNMVAAGEESGQLDKTFGYLADYMDRNYEITSKAKSALIYPAFVISTFIGVMILMLTMVIPKISSILVESGQEIPIYTRITLGISSFFVHYGILLLIALIILGFFGWKHIQTEEGERAFANLKLRLPVLGDIYRKLYLSRIADNMNTMLISGISMVAALESTLSIVENKKYKDIIANAIEEVRAGAPVSEALGRNNDEIPGIMIQMIRVGEETGELGNILKTLSHFYQREVVNAVDTLVSLIEPAMIVLLGLGVGFLLASVLIPIYNISGAI
ncbi:MAG: type II secretion system F family protein [Candidatus Paceibacterota bacterium]